MKLASPRYVSGVCIMAISTEEVEKRESQTPDLCVTTRPLELSLLEECRHSRQQSHTQVHRSSARKNNRQQPGDRKTPLADSVCRQRQSRSCGGGVGNRRYCFAQPSRSLSDAERLQTSDRHGGDEAG